MGGGGGGGGVGLFIQGVFSLDEKPSISYLYF